MQGKSFMDRYVNIKPWNHNRVKLQVPEGELDYVNASAIALQSPSDSTRPPLRYIAMQGPTVPSVDYVWRMIAEQMEGTAVIVQLTGMVEGTTVKCHQYFPVDPEQPSWVLNEGNAWGDGWLAHLTLASTEILADGAIEKRKLTLHVDGEEDREPLCVWHFLYLRWPDFGVPTGADLESFFALMSLSREYTFHANPRVVHCSAGVGRTGTFIALEHLIRELEMGALENHDHAGQPGPDLVFNTVDKLREQRKAMVQGDIQFAFIYTVLRTLWEEKYADGSSGGEPAAKRLEMLDGDPFTDNKTPAEGAAAGAAAGAVDGHAAQDPETR
jgi:protein-tyrosine phosphatase